MPSEVLDNLKGSIASLPGATWWVDELLFRGEPADAHGGKLKGAHVVFGMRYKGPDGEEHTKVTQPLPVGDGPRDVPMGELLDDLHISQQAAIDAHLDTNKKLTRQLEEFDAEVKTLKAEKAALDNALSVATMDKKLADVEIMNLKAEVQSLQRQIQISAQQIADERLMKMGAAAQP